MYGFMDVMEHPDVIDVRCFGIFVILYFMRLSHVLIVCR